ncbi:hypothetical protein D3C75_629820 [compost metagenome]
MGGTNGWMAGERQLRSRSKNPHPIVGRLFGLGDHKGGFGQVCPVCDLLHLCIGEAISLQHYSNRVALVALGSENIDLFEANLFHIQLTIFEINEEL